MTDVDATKTQFSTTYEVDKIALYSTTTDGQGYTSGASITVGAAALPSTTVFTGSVANPYGKKCLPTLCWSLDGVNFYPQNVPIFYFNATYASYFWRALAFMGCSDSTLYVGVTSQYGSSQTIYIQLALDSPT